MLLKNYKKHKEKQVKWCKSSDFAEMSGAFALFTELLFIVYLNIMYVHATVCESYFRKRNSSLNSPIPFYFAFKDTVHAVIKFAYFPSGL